MNIPLANPARELKKIKNFQTRFNKKLNQGVYVGGKDVTTFEENIASYIGSKYCVAVNSGTDALLLSLIALGIKKGDKVVVPSFTFFATIEVVMHLGAIPIFVDINTETYTIDVDDFKKKVNQNIKAVIPVHLFGNNANIDEIKKICSTHNIKIIEDVAQAFGSGTENNTKLGSIGDIGAFSFFPSKTLGGIGDGGCIVTNNLSHYKKVLKLRNHGQGKNYEHEFVGANSRLDSLNAFVLNEKLSIFPEIKKSRDDFYDFYIKNLSHFDWIKLPIKENENTILNYFTITVPPLIRNKLLSYLNQHQIGASIYYKKPIHLQKAVLDRYKKISIEKTEKISKCVISLPFYSFPEDKELDYLISKINKFK
jgi:dTDP-4-amino-4,6-dideoxygalactose transaminase